jgi:hypothetical protein
VIAPDLVRGTVDVVGQTVTFRIRLLQGTFDPTTTRFVVNLDTDQNQSTGVGGLEYRVFMSTVGGRGADVLRTTTSAPPGVAPLEPVGTVPLTFVADGVDVTVPLTLLAKDDGRMDFSVLALAEIPQTGAPVQTDIMPDMGHARVG